jgi:hypothetical protein
MNTSKIRFGIHHGAYALKKYTKIPLTHNSLAYLSSRPIVPAVVNDEVGQTLENPDPSSWHPHYMRIHRR